MRLLWTALAAALLATITVVAAHPAAAASLTQVTNFGNNPTNLKMYVYVPNTVAARPALLVAIHYCGGSASAMYGGNAHDYVTAADRYGYVIVFPEVTRSTQCFDVYSPEALRRGGGSDPVGIISMVDYAKQHYNVDSARVFVTGFSSGAMMTNVMAAEYPDVFAAGSAFSGVPATCFATGSSTNTWNSQCSGGQITKTAQQWGDAARAMYPGYTGRYPRMQLWHGSTDTTLSYVNFGEEIKQWTNLNGLSQTPAFTDHPQSSWTRTRYGDTSTTATVEGVSIANTGHTLPQAGILAYAISFLGLNRPGTPTTAPTTTAPTSAAPTTGTSGPVSTSAWYVVVNRNSGKAVDVYGRATTDGGRITQWTRNDGTNQQWQFVDSGGGYYRLKSRLSGKVLDVSGFSTANGAAVQQWTDLNGTNQQWRLADSGGGYLRLINRNSNKALEVQGASTADGGSVVQYDDWGGTNQQWQLVRVG